MNHLQCRHKTYKTYEENNMIEQSDIHPKYFLNSLQSEPVFLIADVKFGDHRSIMETL